MSFLLSPILSLFSLSFYRKMAEAPLTKGFLYLVYFSAIMSLVLFAAFVTVLLPKIDLFAEWTQATMPVMTLQKEGLSLKGVQGPYTMKHPQLGDLVTFDMAKTNVTTEEMGPAFVFVTAKRLFMKTQNRGEIRAYDLTQGNNAPGQGMPVEITPERAGSFYQSMRPWAMTLALVLGFFFFVIGNLIGALMNSVFGMLLNLMRRPKLSYSGILNLSFFAMTAATLIRYLQILIPAANRLPLGVWGGFSITAVYLFIGIKLTEPHAQKEAGL